MHTSRRAFLAAGSVAAAATLLHPSTNAAQAALQSDAVPATHATTPRDTVMKFNQDGSRRPFAGNTVICHLPAQCAMRDAMAAFHDAMTRSTFAAKLGLTSVDSYHMTIFPGANDQGRSATGWPSYVPPDASMEACDRAVGERMAAARLHGHLPFRVEIDREAMLRYPRAATLRMRAVDAAEEKNLRAVRDQLAEVYGIRRPDHDAYGFHITLSYQVDTFTPGEQKAYDDLRAEHVRRIMEAQPVLELGNPEFCTFPDMFRFEPRRLLAVC